MQRSLWDSSSSRWMACSDPSGHQSVTWKRGKERQGKSDGGRMSNKTRTFMVLFSTVIETLISFPFFFSLCASQSLNLLRLWSLIYLILSTFCMFHFFRFLFCLIFIYSFALFSFVVLSFSYSGYFLISIHFLLLQLLGVQSLSAHKYQ